MVKVNIEITIDDLLNLIEEHFWRYVIYGKGKEIINSVPYGNRNDSFRPRLYTVDPMGDILY